MKHLLTNVNDLEVYHSYLIFQIVMKEETYDLKKLSSADEKRSWEISRRPENREHLNEDGEDPTSRKH